MWDSAESVDFDTLPEEFVLKPNHLSGAVILCRDKATLDLADARERMRSWLSWNYYWQNGEWQYKDIPPKILCEKLLHGEIIDYKFFCFHGEVKFAYIVTKRSGDTHRATMFDLDFNRLPFQMHHHRPDAGVEKPPHWEEMLVLAAKLCKAFLFVRVDLYDLEGKVYFGELTFTPDNGMEKFEPFEWDERLGEWLDLSRIPQENLV